jgi:hypothetical protein
VLSTCTVLAKVPDDFQSLKFEVLGSFLKKQGRKIKKDRIYLPKLGAFFPKLIL